MKKLTGLLLTLALVVTIAGCTKETPVPEADTDGASQQDDTQEQDAEEAIDERVAMYRAAVYSDTAHKEWLATLSKGEQVELLKELSEPVTLKGKEETLAKVRLSDDSEGYIRLRYLADRAVVITEEEVPVYSRNNKTSGQKGTLPKGTVAFVVDQKANWLKVTAGDQKIYNKWIIDGYSDDRSLVTDALIVEEQAKILRGEKDGDTDAARVLLDDIAQKDHAVSSVAQEVLDGGSQEEEYEYPEDAQLATVEASNLRIREEPDTDAEEITMAPEESTVQILEEQDEEVEIGGSSGRWTKVNYEGTEGWAFGAFLEKQ